MIQDENVFITIVKEVERWANIIGNTAKDILDTEEKKEN